MLRKIVQFSLRKLFAATELDLLGAMWRLRPLAARHTEISALFSLDDSPGPASSRLISLATAFIAQAHIAKLPLLEERGAPELVTCWPGDHYRLLAGIVEEMKPNKIVEIGTYTGLSVLAMLPALPRNASISTFDVIPWNQISGTYLNQEDFCDGRLTQVISDLSRIEEAMRYAELLRNADFVFVDGPKDGRFEQRFIDNLRAIGVRPGTLLMFDDIRVWRMLDIWRGIPCSKLDITSFGHFSGTGLVEWG